MKYLGFITIALIAIAITYHGCTYDVLTEPIQPEFCDTATVTYNNQVKAIIDNHCTYSSCHSGGAPGNFTQYNGLKSRVDNGKIEERVLNLKNMPPSYVPAGEPDSLTTEQLEIISCWLSQGAPEG